MLNTTLCSTRTSTPSSGACRRALALALAGGLLLAPVGPALAQTTTAQPADTTTSGNAARQIPASFADLAAAKLPAVVTITARSGVASGSSQSSDNSGGNSGGGSGSTGPELGPFSSLPDSPLRDFMENLLRRQMPGFGAPPEGAPPGRPTTALGSGFIVDPSGYIVTNNHVVEHADKVEVTLHDKRTLPAKVIGTDPKTDLALVKVESDQPLPSVSWGDSDQMRVGDWVVAIGNPFGLGGTVTAGIISARARDIGEGPYDDFLQTDAAINRGNSGGPMFNVQGQVIGVNTAIFSQSGGNIGIGFAIPASLAKPIIAELRQNGHITRGWLGVAIQPLTPEIASALNTKSESGALVASVQDGSPAAKAGVETGDVITQYDGKAVNGPHDLTRLVADTKPGSSAQVTVLRDGKTMSLSVQIAELQQQPQQAAAGKPGEHGEGRLGLTLAPMSPELRKEFSLDADQSGAVVVQVAPNSPAARSGFKPGDVITRAGQQPVEKPGDVARAVEEARKANKDQLLILRQRENGSLFVPLPIG